MMPECKFRENNGGATAFALPVSRRQFLRQIGVLGGGIIVYFTVGAPDLWARMKRGEKVPTDFNAFLRIGADGRVACLSGKIEMGQGAMTALPQMLAEELDVPYDAVDIIMGDTDLCAWDRATVGSRSIREFGPLLREAAVEARGVLKELAAEYLMVPVERLQTQDGVVFDKTRPISRVTYGRLTRGKIIERYLKDIPPLKPAPECRVMGKSFLRRDSYEKVTGRAQFAGDIRLPKMMYASILRPPAHGAGLLKVDTSVAEQTSGAQVVRDGDFIAVLHERPDEAEAALFKIDAQYSRPDTGIDDKNIFDHLLRKVPEPEIASEGGNLQTGQSLATALFEETYLNSYVAHATIETHTATARFEGDKLTVWVSTQAPFRDQQTISEKFNLPLKNVRVITPYVGAGFGGKSTNQQAIEAVHLARLSGRPVQVAWSRAEEFFYDRLRPAAVVKIKSGLNSAGAIVLWDYRVYYAGSRGCEQFYDIPHHREASHGGTGGSAAKSHPFYVGAWRAPGNNTNTYARELHIDLMAARAGIDPLEFRLRNLKDKRMIGVLKAAAGQFGWKAAKAPSGRGFGIACGIDAGTYVALMAEVEVDKGAGKVKVNRVVCAQDMGFAVNPQGAILQMEGCIAMGLGYCLTEEIHFKNGQMDDLNFGAYEIPRFSWMPRIETVLVENNELAPQGGGEPAIVCMGGVIATAIYDATGARLFQLPMTPDRVKAALNKV
jgi:isoquinoline 1-oxidoreductase